MNAPASGRQAGRGSTIDVPGAEVRGTPAFRCLLPAGWAVGEAPGALLVMRPDGMTDASVLVSTSRVDATTDLRDVAVRSFARQRAQHPGLRLDSQRVGRFGDRITYVRGVTVPGEPERSQIHALFFGPQLAGRVVADAVTVVGSCSADDIESYGPLFVDIVPSFEFPETRW